MPSTLPRTASASPLCSTSWASCTRRRAWPSPLRRRWPWPRDIGYPLLVRPSYVLGGRGMMIAYDAEHLRDYMAEAARMTPDYPVYLDRFLEGAIECDVDALCDGEEVFIGGILEHIEEAGIHSGDSACIPPFSFSESLRRSFARLHAPHRDGAGRPRPGQRAVRHQGRDRLRDRGQPAREPHRAVYLQGAGVPLAQYARRVSWQAILLRAWPAERRTSAGLVLHEGSRYALRPLSRAPTLSWGPR